MIDIKKYWEERLSSLPNLQGTGHLRFDLPYNDWLYQTQQDCLVELLKKYKITVKGKSVLDVGSGTGFYVERFLRMQAHTLTGIDLTQASVSFLQDKFPLQTFHQADITECDLPFQDRFDVVTAMGLLYHILDDQRFFQAVTNLCEFLKPSGFLFITDTFRKPVFPSSRHVQFRATNKYMSIFQLKNVEILEISPLYYLSNRTIIPYIGPWIQSLLRLGKLFYYIDRYLRNIGLPNVNGLKILLARRDTAS